MAGEWTEKTLGEVLSFSNGRSNPERADGLPYPVYGSNGIIGYAGEANSGPDTIVIGRVGSYCGSLHFSHPTCWVTDNAIRAVALNDNSPRYLFYLLWTLQLNQWRGGSGQPLLNQSTLSMIPAPIPPLKEQRAITRILGSLDDKIELNRRMNETLEAMARAIFKSWFVDFDPVRAKAEGRDPGLPKHIADLFPDSFQDSGLGKIPRGWVAGVLDDIGANLRRTVRPDDLHEKTPYIGLEHMPRRAWALSEWGCAEELASGKFLFRRGEVLFGKLRPYFHKVGIAAIDGICSTDILVIVPKANQWRGFVLGIVSSDAFVNYTAMCSTGTKMPRTKWQDMRRYRIAIPPRALAEAFSQLVYPLMARIIATAHESRRLGSVRDALLPKLISGEIRVDRAKKIMKEVG
ncbi:MAG: restriction endonuclease subunit S [Candidatus Eisenbacteria bacterium]